MVLVAVDLKNISDGFDKEVVKKDVYDEVVKKNNAIKTTDTADLVKFSKEKWYC